MSVATTQNSKYCVFSILIAQIPIGLLLGFNLTALNSSAPAIKVFINSSYANRCGEPATEGLVTLILTFSQSILVWGSFVGALLVGFILHKLSRKQALLFIHVLNVVSVIFMAPIAKYAQSYESLVVGRFFAGVSRGLGLSIIMVIVTETTCRKKLGLFQSSLTPIMSIASVLGAGLGHSKVFGTPDLWVWIMYAPLFPSLAFFACFYWLTETPVYLIKIGNKDGAVKVLRKLRRGNGIEEEIDTIKKELDDKVNIRAVPLRAMLSSPLLRFQFFTAMVAMLSPQLSGMQAIFMYSDSLLIQAGIDQQYVTYGTMAIFLQSLVAFGLYTPLHRRFGTTKLFIAGLTIAAFTYIIFTVAVKFQKTMPSMSYVALASMCVMLFGIQFGPQMTMLSLPAELTTATSRPTVVFYSGSAFWCVGGIISFVSPFSVAAWGVIAYVPFVLLCFMLLPFAIIAIPETHKRTTASIQNSFHKMSTESFLALVGIKKARPIALDIANDDTEKFDMSPL